MIVTTTPGVTPEMTKAEAAEALARYTKRIPSQDLRVTEADAAVKAAEKVLENAKQEQAEAIKARQVLQGYIDTLTKKAEA